MPEASQRVLSHLGSEPLYPEIYEANCPMRSVLDHVGSRWGALVFLLLAERTHRFSELAARIGGVSEKMLAQTLRTLEHDGFVLRTVYPTKPPKVEYSLTPLGADLGSHITALAQWIASNVDEVVAHRKGRD